MRFSSILALLLVVPALSFSSSSLPSSSLPPPPSSSQLHSVPEPPPSPPPLQATQTLPAPVTPPPGYLRRRFPTLPWLQLPDILTYIRCLSIPLFTLIYFLPHSPSFDPGLTSSLIFAIASLTDYIDGYLARRWNVCSDFGAFLDPVADKIMVGTALILTAGEFGRKLSVPTAIIIGREIGVSALREFMSGLGKRNLVKVGYLGKVKTAVTMISLTGLLVSPGPARLRFLTSSVRDKLFDVSVWGIWVSAVLTIASAVPYFTAGFKVLRES